MIIGHHNKYNNNDNVWNIAKMAKKWYRDMKWAKAVRKMAPIDLLHSELPQTFKL